MSDAVNVVNVNRGNASGFRLDTLARTSSTHHLLCEGVMC